MAPDRGTIPSYDPIFMTIWNLYWTQLIIFLLKRVGGWEGIWEELGSCGKYKSSLSVVMTSLQEHASYKGKACPLKKSSFISIQKRIRAQKAPGLEPLFLLYEYETFRMLQGHCSHWLYINSSLCVACSTILHQPTGREAWLTEGYSSRSRQCCN